jgi:hypothetical protein
VPPESVRDVIDRAREAYATLAELGEEIDDEWSYVNDLAETWRTRFDEVDVARGGEPVSDVVAAAVDRAIEEVERIADPHRAIDWLSTFPQVVVVALGERP